MRDRDAWPDWHVETCELLELLIATIADLGATMTENQTHLDNDIAALTAAFGSVVSELKAQVAAAGAAGAVDFSKADALLATVQAEAAADAPAPAPAPVTDVPAPASDPAPADTAPTPETTTADVPAADTTTAPAADATWTEPTAPTA